ncbi:MULTISPECIES: protein kinase domain-containing protein [Metabacillus]|uniref:Protein kinase family protein n=1 Tax=Metabacillus rhizolycopersici TaxID=2875709 RepID=A0ABS7USC6_9BACI|nr:MULTISPECIES: protein kinase family protein [Metabacillus]MBZ5751185.1 protein kinase family protein [Metabacillus rhizolycopersici]MCM3655052.1 protein kinase family protein [Metabacillus litoralis]
MKKNTTMNQVCNLSSGTEIKGKWNGKRYIIVRALGQGATGNVYLADSSEGNVAIKLSENSMAITSEVNVLKHFSKVQGTSLGPSLLDVDDWKIDQYKILPFYVMEYVQGNNFLEFVQERGMEWANVLVLQLLANLEKLHQQGWVFGDLKPENILISGPPPKIRCIDVGGTTQQGRSIKEFTEFFDRGYWGLGTRKAEPTYDLFSVAMILINATYPKRFTKKEEGDGRNQLFEVIDQHPFLRKQKEVLQKALLGKYVSAGEMKSDFVHLLSSETSKAGVRTKTNKTQTTSSNNSKRQHIRHSHAQTNQSRKQAKKSKKRKKASGILETILILAGVFLIYSLYVYHFLM